MDEITYKKERDRFFDNAFRKAYGKIEDYRFRGWNNALGCFVESKDHYKVLLKQRNLVPSELADELVEMYKNNSSSGNVELSEESKEIVNALKMSKQKDGSVKIEGRLLEKMIERGSIDMIDRQHIGNGGFS